MSKQTFKITALAFVMLASWFLCNDLISGEESPWDVYAKAAKLYEQNGSTQEILSLCDVARKRAEEPFLMARIALLESQVLADQKDFRKAHKILEDLLLAGKKLPAAVVDEARLRDAQLSLQEGQSDRALGLFAKVAQNSGNAFLRQEAQLAMAWQLSHADRHAAADSTLDVLVQMQRLYEKDERVLIVRARHELANQNPAAAIEILKSSEDVAALFYLARAYEQAGKPMMAVGILKKITDRAPNSPEGQEALFQAGDVFMRAEDWVAAREQFNRFLQTYPNSARGDEVQFRLGWTYLKKNDFDAALLAYRSINLPRYQSHIAYMEAECLRRSGAGNPEKLQEAINKYNSIVALDPNSTLAPLAKLRAAITLMEQDRQQDATISLRQFLSLFPKDELASAATFFLATQQAGNNYFEEILQKYAGSIIFDAALASLQQRDYDAAEFQQVINRQAQFQRNSAAATNDFQRMQHLILAEAYYYLRQYEPAQREYALAQTRSEDELTQKASIGQAWCTLQSGRLDAAATQFENLRKKSTGIQQAHAAYGLATAYFQLKRYEDAIRTYPVSKQQVLEPELAELSAKSLLKVGESYFRLQYFGQAIDYWKQLVTDYSQSQWAPQAHYRLADTYFRANHFDDALAAFQQVLTNYPGHPMAIESSLRLAQCEYNAQKYEDAIVNFKNFISNYPNHNLSKEALEGIQLCYYQLGQNEGATEALRKVIEQSPGTMLSADARFRLASSYLEANQPEEAIRAFKEILTLYPGTSYAVDSQLALAKTYFALKQYESANAEFARFIQYFPESPNIAEATFHLGVGYFSSESYMSAAEKFNEIISRFPDGEFYGASLQNIGWCYDLMGEKEQALSFFSDYVAFAGSSPEQAKIQLQVARIQKELGRTKEAMAVYQSLQKSSDKEVAVEAAFALGQSHIELRQIPRAKEAFQMAIRVGQKENGYRLKSLAELAFLSESEQNWKQAVVLYQELKQSTSDPTWVAAADERIETLTALIAGSGN
jgi:TolA-binding protein